MDMNKRDIQIIQRYIDQWRKDAIINDTQADQMRESIQGQKNSYTTLTTFAFIVAGCSALLAVISILFEARFIDWLQMQFDFATITIGILFSVLSILMVGISYKYKHKFTTFSRESLNLASAITLAIGITYLGRSQEINEVYYPTLIGITAIILLGYAYILQSKILWGAAILTATGWQTTQAFLWWGDDDSTTTISLALTSTIWGMTVWSVTALYKQRLTIFKHTQNVIGILLTLFAAWTLSIFGTYTDYDAWEMVRQGKLWYWALLYTITLIALTYYGVKQDKDYIRDIAMSFFILNIYTRYFEYFWDKTHKGIFFAILAVSFYFVGKQFDTIRKRTS